MNLATAWALAGEVVDLLEKAEVRVSARQQEQIADILRSRDGLAFSDSKQEWVTPADAQRIVSAATAKAGRPLDADTGLPVVDEIPDASLATACQFARPETLAMICNDILMIEETAADPVSYLLINTIREAMIEFFEGYERQAFKDSLRPGEWAASWRGQVKF